MSAQTTITPRLHTDPSSLAEAVGNFIAAANMAGAGRPRGLCGFDGFIDTFIRVQSPATMAGFGPKVTAAAGISTSFPVMHQGDKFGGNGPLFATALHDIHAGNIDITYAGAVGDGEMLPIFKDALDGRMRRVHALARPAHSTCMEFADGKIMLSDMRACADVTWKRLLECMEHDGVRGELAEADFISAVNWGKLPNAGEIWSNLAEVLTGAGVPAKKVVFFMDLAEFETRPREHREDLLGRLTGITRQCATMLGFNLKEAWQMGEVFGPDFSGRKDPEAVAELAGYLRSNIDVDRIIIHPNDGAALADDAGVTYVAGPYCRDPLISTGAGDNFGAGCLAGALRGMDDAGILLTGNAASGYFVRTGRSPTFAQMAGLLRDWSAGRLGERL